jgi:hypothetical protein
MTVFVTDVREGERLWQVRKDVFGTTITAVASPDPKLEIQGYAVIGSK